ncbi:nucleotidyltransferase family protein [Vibrio lentus]|nr:nucleotidyltransferase family protein [Vibrio lentus]
MLRSSICSIQPYERVEQGIESWLSAFAWVLLSIIQKTSNCSHIHGLDDAFNMLIKPNKQAMTEANYSKMTAGYKARWQQVQVLSWR